MVARGVLFSAVRRETGKTTGVPRDFGCPVLRLGRILESGHISQQLSFTEDAADVSADQLGGSMRRLATCPQAVQHGRDDWAVDLTFDAVP